MDGARRLRSNVRRNATREGELAKQPPQTFGVLGDVGVGLRIGTVQVRIGDKTRTAMTWAGNVDRRLRALANHSVEMRIDEVQTWRGAPVPEQAGLDIVARKGGSQQRVTQQVDLAHGQVVRGAPPTIQLGEGFVAQLQHVSGTPGG